MRLTPRSTGRLLRLLPLLAGFALVACGPLPTAGSTSPSPSSRGRFAFARNGAFGQLVQISGQTLTLSGQTGDSTVTYTTTTTIEQTSAGSLGDIVTGTCVVATGSKGSGGAVTAATVEVRPATGTGCAAARPGGGSGRPFPTRSPRPRSSGTPRASSSSAVVDGEVTAATGTQITVKTATGTSESLTVPTTAKVTDESSATASALQVNLCVAATGKPGSSGKVAATSLTLSQPDSSGTCTEAGFGFGGGGGGGFRRRSGG
ncbi:MAG TPA: hypothetical protein VIA06_14940 [Candidatus Dormibacteraeota bacterium]|jgi:hypothetical protein|nr:hypothetical protein [Candidatus Dormibacteraeota bacterium]